jgi:hypothetical protein
MNYQTIYDAIIFRAKNRVKSPGLERHHIIPKSCGGQDVAKNLVFLTAREHFVCHLLLIKIYNNPIYKKKMIYALWWMAKTRNNLNGYRVTSHSYALARKKFIENSPNKCEERKKRFIENYKAGKYNYDYQKVSNSMKLYLKSLSFKEKQDRMKKSALSCDQSLRAESIKKGKGSYFLLTKLTGETVTFWSYDDVFSITGYRYDQIKYRLKKYNGVLENGDTVFYIKRYTGNDNNIGRKRNNSISIGTTSKQR